MILQTLVEYLLEKLSLQQNTQEQQHNQSSYFLHENSEDAPLVRSNIHDATIGQSSNMASFVKSVLHLLETIPLEVSCEAIHSSNSKEFSYVNDTHFFNRFFLQDNVGRKGLLRYVHLIISSLGYQNVLHGENCQIKDIWVFERHNDELTQLTLKTADGRRDFIANPFSIATDDFHSCLRPNGVSKHIYFPKYSQVDFVVFIFCKIGNKKTDDIIREGRKYDDIGTSLPIGNNRRIMDDCSMSIFSSEDIESKIHPKVFESKTKQDMHAYHDKELSSNSEKYSDEIYCGISNVPLRRPLAIFEISSSYQYLKTCNIDKKKSFGRQCMFTYTDFSHDGVMLTRKLNCCTYLLLQC